MKLVGKVKEAHGLKGDLYILILSGDVSWLSKLKEFELRAKGSATDAAGTKYKVERAKPFKNGFIVKAAEITDRNQSEAVEQMDFYIADDLLISKPGEGIYLSEIMNFKLKDTEQNTLGEIIGLSSNGVQDLLTVKTATGQAEVPFVDAFLKKIDFKHQYIVMDLPEGLLDLESIDAKREEA